MMYCPKCGLRNDDYDLVCKYCGAVLGKKAAKKRKKSTPFSVGLLVLLLGVCGFFGIKGCFRESKAPEFQGQIREISESGTTSPTMGRETESTIVTTPTERPETEPHEAETHGGLIYDDRQAQYSGENPQWETLTYRWDTQDSSNIAEVELEIDQQMYQHYRNLGRYYGPENFYLYVNDENNTHLVRQLITHLKERLGSLAQDNSAVAEEIANFVQDAIEYQYDLDSTGIEEYPRYPIETLYEGQGDCEDSSILMAAMLKEWGYTVGFLYLPNHIAVAIRTSDTYNNASYYEINGHRYLFIESTGSGWKIGEIPDGFQESSAQFYLIP